MKKYFLRRLESMSTSGISASQIENYREMVIVEMKKQGASDSELALVHEATILNSIENDRRPEDVAWAILQ